MKLTLEQQHKPFSSLVFSRVSVSDTRFKKQMPSHIYLYSTPQDSHDANLWKSKQGYQQLFS